MADAFYIGMDLCSDFTQLSFFNDITRKPESVSQLNNKETYLMPNILFHSTATGHWYVGGEASEARFNEKGVVIDKIFENLSTDAMVTVDGDDYSYPRLFMKMVGLHINSFLYRYEDASIKKLVISLPEYDALIYRLLSGLWKELGVAEDVIEITSHLDSGLFYIFNQEQGLWNNAVALYDYSADGLDYYRIIAKEAKRHLLDGGDLLVEIGFDQAAEVTGLFKEAGYDNIEVIKDLSGLDRVVACRTGKEA